MKTRILTEDEAIQLATRPEDHFFDRKAAKVSGKQVEKIAVALANSDGGEFVVGVADESDVADPRERWQGVDTIEELNSHLQVLFAVSPSLDLRYEFLKREGDSRYVLRVIVEKSSEVHQTSAGRVYVRHGGQSLPITDANRITELSFAKGATTFEDRVLETLSVDEIVDSTALGSFLGEYSPRTDPLEFLLNQNLLDGKSWDPRVCAALLFHPNPSSVLPRKCAVKITRYETKEDEPERDHLAEQETIEGPSYELIHQSVDSVRRMMSAVQIWVDGSLKKLEYPPEAVWEVLVNAIIHRDYSVSDDVQVLVFNNRIELLSPGRLPGYVTVENILQSRYSRNPKLVRTLNRYPDAPNKDLGEGLNTTFQKMKEWGLQEPEIFEQNGYVKVVLPHTPLASPSEAILQFLEKHQTITNREAREITGIKSENLVKIEFYKLRDAGIIERVPGLKGPKSAWHLKS